MSTTLNISEKQRTQACDFIGHTPSPVFTSEGEQAHMPDELNALLRSILGGVAEGGTVVLQTLPEELSTTVAAEQLGVSRPTLMKMIKDGELPAHKVGSHHRVKLADVRAFRRARLECQRQAFEELRQLDDELG